MWALMPMLRYRSMGVVLATMSGPACCLSCLER
jgi:hypothetical protein